MTVHVFASHFAVATVAYLGTMVDNLFAFAAQLALSPRDRFNALCMWQTGAVVTLVVVAVSVGSFLSVFPLRLIGVLALAPWWLAWRAWRHRHDATSPVTRRAGFSAFVVTVALGADNLAVWIPIFRANPHGRLVIALLVFAVWQGLFVAVARGLASHPRLREHGAKISARAVPGLYALLGVVIIIQCGTLKF